MKGIEIYDVEVSAYDNVCDEGRIIFNWVANIGWGQCTFREDKKNKKWTCDKECMGKEFIKELFNKFLEDIGL